MVVQHNMQAANANRMLNVTTGQQAKSTEKLSSGSVSYTHLDVYKRQVLLIGSHSVMPSTIPNITDLIMAKISINKFPSFKIFSTTNLLYYFSNHKSIEFKKNLN